MLANEKISWNVKEFGLNLIEKNFKIILLEKLIWKNVDLMLSCFKQHLS